MPLLFVVLTLRSCTHLDNYVWAPTPGVQWKWSWNTLNEDWGGGDDKYIKKHELKIKIQVIKQNHKHPAMTPFLKCSSFVFQQASASFFLNNKNEFRERATSIIRSALSLFELENQELSIKDMCRMHIRVEYVCTLIRSMMCILQTCVSLHQHFSVLVDLMLFVGVFFCMLVFGLWRFFFSSTQPLINVFEKHVAPKEADCR